MDIKQLAKKYALGVFNAYEDETEMYTFSEGRLELFAQSIIAAHDAKCATDAARYRYLRSQVNQDEGIPMAQVVWKLHWVRDSSNWANLVDGNNLDEHCDRALRGE